MRKISLIMVFVFMFCLAPLVELNAEAIILDSRIISVNGQGGATVKAYDIINGNITISNLRSGNCAVVKANAPAAGIYVVNMSVNAAADGSIIITADSSKERITFKKGTNTYSKYIMLKKGENEIQICGEDNISPVINNINILACSTRYEAEAGLRTGYAVISEDKTASGGAVVKRIGGPNTDIGAVVFDVYAPTEGTYGLIVDYIPQGKSPFYINTGSENEVEVPLTGGDESGFTKPGRRYAEVKLKAGDNSLKIFSKKEYTIDLDCITVFAPSRPFDGGLEDGAAKLNGAASVRRCYGADNGYVITGLGPNGSAEFNVRAESSGTYSLRIWYSSAAYKGLEVYVDGALRDTLFCPITGEDYNIGTVDMHLDLSMGGHTIKFANSVSPAPDIDKIQLTKIAGQAAEVCNDTGIWEFKNDSVKVEYDMHTGIADVYFGDVLRVKGMQSAVKINGIKSAVKSSDYKKRSLQVTNVSDGYGEGKIYAVTSEGPNMPKMIQSFYVYDKLPYILVKVELSDPNGVASNFMAPITAMGDDCVRLDNKSDMRSLFVPFDNDNWVKYGGDPLDGQHTSYWVSAVYDNTSRNALIAGSVDHDTWKTGVSIYGKGNKVNFFGAFGGIWSAQYTFDYLPHGSIDGQTISSPKMFLGYFDDWRDGMEAYGDANNRNVPMLKWDGPVPFGYNSWYAQGSSLNFNDSVAASNFFKGLQNNGFEDKGTVYINLDSYWDNLSDAKLKEFVDKCKANGQKAGIYWSHFVFWATDMSWGMGNGSKYTFRDAAVGDGYGGVAAMAKDSSNIPLDPTSPAMKERLKYYMQKFVNLGFEYLKIDFLNYASIEGKHYDPNIKTGMQAYNYALKEFTKYVDTSKFFLSYSIAPLFPYQYAHARRIACDTAANIGEVSYMLNSFTYGWWMDGRIYQFVDPDHISLSASAAEGFTRYNSAVITGGMMLMSDKYSSAAMRDFTRQVTSNKEVNDIARAGKAFRPVEGNTGQGASDLFVLNTDDAFYLAVFNYSSTEGKKRIVDMERIGLDKNKTYSVRDLWSKKCIQVKGSFSVELTPAQSTIYKITAAQ